MKQFHKIFTLFAAMLTGFSHAYAGGPVLQTKQLILVSGGSFGAKGNLVRFYSYDPFYKKIMAFDSLPGNYTNAALVDNNVIYANVDTVLYKYDADTYKKIDSLVVPGINHMAIDGNYLLIARSYPATSNYIKVFNKNTLKEVFTDTKVMQACNNILMLRDTAYIAESSSDSGRIAVLSLGGSTPVFVREINMDTNAINIQDLATDGKFIYTYSYGYTPMFTLAPTRASAYEIRTGKHQFLSAHPMVTNLLGGSIVSNYGSVTIFGTVNNKFQSFKELGFNSSNASQPLSAISNSVYTNGLLDTLNGSSYLINNDFIHNASIIRLENVLQIKQDSFNTGVSTQAIAIDYRTITGIDEVQISTIDFSVYPNPANGILNVSLPAGEKYKVSILDITGKEMMNNFSAENTSVMNVSSLPNGVYIVRVQNNANTGVQKFIRQ